MAERLTDLLVNLFTVEVYSIEIVAGGAVSGEVRVVLRLLKIHCAAIEGKVRFAGFKRDKRCVGVGDNLKGQSINGRGALVIVRIGLKDNLLCNIPLLKFVGASANRMFRRVVSHFGHRLFVGDIHVCKHAQKRTVWIFEVDLDRVVVNCFGVLNHERAKQHPLLADKAVNAVNDIVGFHLLSVVELDSLLKMKSVRIAGFIHFPRIGERGNDLMIWPVFHKPVKDVGAEADLRAGGKLKGIECCEIVRKDDNEVVARGAAGRRISALCAGGRTGGAAASREQRGA